MKYPEFQLQQRNLYTLKARRFRLKLGSETKIMGIINVTPDSFSGDGLMRYSHFHKKAIAQAKQFIKEGAHLLDIGGESTRPGSKPIPSEEEIKRVIPIIKSLVQTVKIPISVDTYKPDVAEHALKAGASIINLIKGINPEPRILNLVKKYKASIILMHILGSPETMQNRIKYDNLIKDIKKALKKSIKMCYDVGIQSDRIIVDPGIGFGKTVKHNFQIINRLFDFSDLGYPILLGPSRKSFIGKLLKKDVRDRIWGTTAAICAGVLRGAHIVRVHDVAIMKDVLRVTDAILNAK